MNELMQSWGVRMSVRLSVCVNFFAQIATSTTNMIGSPPNLHMTVPTWADIQDMLKVKRKGHMIRTLLWCHEMFAIQYLLTFCLYMHSLYEALLHSPSSISVRQLDVLSTSWNELVRHWRSGLLKCILTTLNLLKVIIENYAYHWNAFSHLITLTALKARPIRHCSVVWFVTLLAHSIGMSLCNREASVCLSVCPSVNFYTQIATSTTNRTRSPLNSHTMVASIAHIQDVLKVKVKGDVIRTLFRCDENRFFYQKQDWIATKLAHGGPHIGLHPGWSQGQGLSHRSRDTGTSVMSRNVCYTVPSDVLSLHCISKKRPTYFLW